MVQKRKKKLTKIASANLKSKASCSIVLVVLFLGAILHAMATAPITAVDVGYKGTQLKLSMELHDKQSVVFKPMW